MTRRPWLSKVAEVLRSPERNLRKLAALGEMDPTNLFIGTSMDGVDIRGQDLRGIRFTHLDLAKVQHDAATLLDGRDALAPDTARVLLAIPRVDQRSIARVIGDRAAFYPLGAEKSFLDEVDGKRPAIIVAAPDTMRFAGEIVDEARRRGCEPLVILAERNRGRDGMPAFSAIEEFGRVLRVLPPTSFRMAPTADTLTGEVRDALAFAIAEWPSLDIYFEDKGGSLIFVRAKGVGEAPSLDGCAQLAERWWREGAPGRPKVLALHDRAARRDFGAALLRPETVTRLPDTVVKTFNCAMLVRLGPPPIDAEEFIDRVHVAAQTATGSRLPFSGWYRSTAGERLTMVGNDFGRPRRPPVQPPPDVRDFDFDRVRAVVLSDHAEIGRVLEHLVENYELLVSPRDILAGPIDGQKLWVLVAAQMRRVMRSAQTLHRQAYLELLVREALRITPSTLRDPRGWEAIMAHPDFAYGFRLSMSRLVVERRETRGHLRLEGRGGNDNIRFTEAILVIDEEGPQLFDPADFRRLQRRTPETEFRIAPETRHS